MNEEYKKFLQTASEDHLAYLLKESANARDSATDTINFEKIHYILTCPEIKNKPSINNLGSFCSNICFSASVEQIKFLMTSPKLSEHLVMTNNHGLIGACSSDNVDVVKFLVENLPEVDLYKLTQNEKNELLYICVQSGSLKAIEYLCFEYESDNKMLTNVLELCGNDNSVYLNILKNPKFKKDLFHPDDLFKSATDTNVFEYLIAEYNYDLTSKDIPKLFEHACEVSGDCILYLLKRKDLNTKYDIHMNNDIIFQKLMDMEDMNMIEELIFNRRLPLTPTIQENMNDIVESLFKVRDIYDIKDKLESNLPETKKIVSKKI